MLSLLLSKNTKQGETHAALMFTPGLIAHMYFTKQFIQNAKSTFLRILQKGLKHTDFL